MRGFSKVILTGNLTRDPELRATGTGNNVCVFTVAVNRSFRDGQGNQQEEVSFLDCTAWGRQGETIAQYCKKGSGILVSGRLRQHKWEDPATKQNRSRVEIVVEEFNFMGSGDSNQGSRGGYGGSNSGANAAPAGGAGFGGGNSGGEVPPEDIPEEEIDIQDIPF